MDRIIIIWLQIIIVLTITGGNSSSFAAVFKVSNASQLQSALQNAQYNGQDDIIRIAQGTYIGNFIYAGHAEEGLILEGGWLDNFSSRVVKAENTVLDGNQTGCVFVFSCDKYVNLTIDGLTFQNGSPDNQHGGGVFIFNIGGHEWGSKDVEIIISNNIIKNNMSSGNAEYRGGAGLYIWTHIKVILRNNIISGNSVLDGSNGGGAKISSATGAEIIGNLIKNNKASHGGGMFLETSYSGRTRILNNTFIGNEAVDDSYSFGRGGGLYAQIYVTETPATISGNIFSGNMSSRYGGGVFLEMYGGLFKITNNQITENQTNTSGGGITIWLRQQEGQALDFINNTVAQNLAGEHAGGLDLWMFQDGDIVNIYNNIFWSNSSANPGYDMYIDNDFDDNYLTGICNLYNNNFNQSGWGTYMDIPFAIHSSNLNNKDPLFVAAWEGNYMLSGQSPCLNKGNNKAPSLPDTDLKGNPRIQDGIVDMGAYEGTQVFKTQFVLSPLMLLLGK